MADRPGQSKITGSGDGPVATLDWADAVRADPEPESRRRTEAHGPSSYHPPRRRRVSALTLLAVLCATLAAAVAGASVFGGRGDGAAASLERDSNGEIAKAERRVAELDAERKRREQDLAELTRRQNARESELAQTQDHLAALERRREEVQKQIADLGASQAPERPSAADDLAEDRPVDESEQTASTNEDERPQLVAAPKQPRAASSDRIAGEGRVRVFIHVLAADPSARSRARAVANELRRRGVDVAEIRGVPHAVRRDAVRYFYDADRAALSAVVGAVQDASSSSSAPVAQDFRGYSAPPRPGTMEVWLS